MHERTARAAGLLLALASLAIPAHASDWPQWRGPDGNSVSEEKGLISTWSKATGQNLIWRLDWVGRSTPAVFDGRVCASGRAELRYEVIACWDAKDGKKLWERRFPEFNTTIPFSRVGWASVSGDPETGYLYSQNGDGHLLCFDKAGQTVWEWRLGEEMGRSSGYGGRTHTPFIDEDRLIMSVVGTGWGDQAALRQRYVAFDKRTGKVLWEATPNTVPVEDFNNQSNAAVAVIGGQRLVIGGGADGFIYALKARTGDLAWKFHFSAKSLNSPPTVVGDIVYAAQSEEPVEGDFMGQVVAFNGTGSGDITKTARIWHTDGIGAGYAGPLYKDGRLYVVSNAGDIHALDAKTGQQLFSHNLGTIGRGGSPVWADGKILATEVNGNVHILRPRADKFESLSHNHLTMPEGRHVEIWGSVAVAYGRLYFAAEDGLYCLGDKRAPFKGPAGKAASRPSPGSLTEEPAPAGAPASTLQVVPADVAVRAAESVAFEVRAYDDKGRPVAAPPAASIAWSLEGLAGTLSPDGRFQPDASKGNQGGKVKATAGALNASARVRTYAPLPWSFDFEGGKVPAEWVSAGRLTIAEGEAGKTLHKAPVQTGLNRATVYIGPATLSGYTVEADLKATRKGRRMPDIGLINGGYTLDMQGNHQRLEVRSWASELAFSKKVDFAWEPDTWYRMKFRVEPAADRTVARGKVWKKSDPEPAEWTIVYEDPATIAAGAPGIYGDSSVDIDWDNLTVVVNR